MRQIFFFFYYNAHYRCRHQTSKSKKDMSDTSAIPVKQVKKNSMSGYAAVNGLSMYYEIHVAGAPLVLIHGGGSTYRQLLAISSLYWLIITK